MFEHEVLIQCLQRITNPMLVSVSGIKFTCSVCVPHGDQLSAASALAAAASSKVPSRMARACSFKPAAPGPTEGGEKKKKKKKKKEEEEEERKNATGEGVCGRQVE
jgi:hypothetical protein